MAWDLAQSDASNGILRPPRQAGRRREGVIILPSADAAERVWVLYPTLAPSSNLREALNQAGDLLFG